VKLVDAAAFPAFFVRLYDYAWFVGFAIGFVLYLILRYMFDKTRATLPLFDSNAAARAAA